MELTNERRKYIDGLSLYELLRKVRFSSLGDEWMQGETGEYWVKKLVELRDANRTEFIKVSKDIGW